MNQYSFTGTHVLCDVMEVASDRIRDNVLIVGAIERGIKASGAELCGMQAKEFEPDGMTAVFVLAESHVSVHTYPEQRSLFLDAFTCGSSCVPQRIVDVLLDALGPCAHRISVMTRGEPSRVLTPASCA